MEAKEKLIELIESMNYEVHESGQVNLDSHTTAKAIIAKYQQIEKKPVQLYKTDDEICIILDKRFATENERQAWLDSHYVELVD